MKHALILAALALLAACRGDESLTAYGAADRVWTLRQIDNVQMSETITLTFPAAGEIAGKAPCNAFSGAQTAPYPWFKAEKIAVTRRACPALAMETAFFEALSAMTLAEVSGDTLILSNTDGREMVFSAD